jgi:gas vesicle protein
VNLKKEKGHETMKTNDESKFHYFLVGIGLGAIAGLLLAPRSGEETRKYLRERSTKGLDTLNQQAGKPRESAEALVQKGKEIMSRQCCNSVDTDTEAEKQAYQEERRETLGG